MKANNKSKKQSADKKQSARKKLIPAVSMFTVSALMLSTATYAWFTMNKEVEVTGITMTATVPENLQISLGDVNDDNDGLNIVDSSKHTVGATIISDIKAPTVDKNTNDWYNTVAFSDYYSAGRLIPASSTDGNYLFKTSDATSQGETVSKTATFTALTLSKYDTSATKLNDQAGLQVNKETLPSNATLSDGYYIDIPVWFRTSVTSSNTTAYIDNSKLNLGVQATITQNTATEASEDLYHAVRVAVIPATANTADAVAATSNITGVISDGVEKNNQKYYDRYATGDNTSTTLTSNIKNQAVKASGTLVYSPTTAKQTNAYSIYGAADIVKQVTTIADGYGTDGEVVVSVPLASAANTYGDSVKYIIRIWIEGEDEYCWNPTAGQDFNVALNFVELKSSTTASETYKGNTGDSSSSTAVTNGTLNSTISVKFSTNDKTYTYNTSTQAFDADFIKIIDDTKDPNASNANDKGQGNTTYKLGDGTIIANSTDLKTYIEKYKDKYELSTIVLTAVTSS